MEGLSSGVIREVIVSDGGSGDRTLDIADEAGCVIVGGAASRGGQLGRGASAAKGEWLLFLHADTLLEPGWAAKLSAHIKAHQAGYFRLQFDAPGFGPSWVAGWANLRSKLFGLPYGDQGLLVPMSVYRAAGGYPDIPLMEDVALARALRGQLRAIPCVATTSWTRYERAGWLKRGSRNLMTLLRYFLGASPERLAESYRK
jgi:rSAM/selenodomain-associated transferase 2